MTQLASANLLPLQDMKVFWRTNGEYFPSQISEISRSGAFIRTPQPAPVGTILALRLELPGHELVAQAIVRRMVPGQGMGVEFDSMRPEDRSRLEALVRQTELNLLSEAACARSTADQQRTSRFHNSAERRNRSRFKFAADAELTESRSGQTVQGQLVNLARSGCFVKVARPFPPGTNLEVSICHNGRTLLTRAAVRSVQLNGPEQGMGLAFGEMEPDQQEVLDAWLRECMERTWLASNRRRSQRVMVSIPVQVTARDGFGSEILEDTRTISVSAHGALLQLEMGLTKGQTIMLRNPSTNDALECSVDYLGAERNGRREVGVSFLLPNRTLWQIAFPPADWSSEHPDAKPSRAPDERWSS